jgi:hypothetical protein
MVGTLQRRHINYKAVFHIAFQHALIRFIDILNQNHCVPVPLLPGLIQQPLIMTISA